MITPAEHAVLTALDNEWSTVDRSLAFDEKLYIVESTVVARRDSYADEAGVSVAEFEQALREKGLIP